MVDSFDIIFKKKSKIKIPICILASKNDPVVDSARTEEFASCLESESKFCNLYDNGQHEIFNDVEREQVIKDMVGFINKNL